MTCALSPRRCPHLPPEVQNFTSSSCKCVLCSRSTTRPTDVTVGPRTKEKCLISALDVLLTPALTSRSVLMMSPPHCAIMLSLASDTVWYTSAKSGSIGKWLCTCARRGEAVGSRENQSTGRVIDLTPSRGTGLLSRDRHQTGRCKRQTYEEIQDVAAA